MAETERTLGSGRLSALSCLRELPALTNQKGRRRLWGALVVTAVAAVPAVFYVAGLGFYLDDHYFLAAMSTSHDRSVLGLFDALAKDDPKAWTRPAMYLGLAVLYRLFGTNPLGYHIVVATLVPLCAVLVYVILDRLRARRFLALGVPIVFAAAPHYSTDRLWLASYAAPASVALALASIYAHLRACSSRGSRLAGWLIAGEAALVISILMYEIAVPLLIVTVIVLWYHGRTGVRGSLVGAVSSSLALAAALVYKGIATTTLAAGTSHALGYQSGILHHFGYLVSGSVKVNFGTYGIGLPYVVWWIVTHHLRWTAIGPGLLVGIVVFAYLARSVRGLHLPLQDQADAKRLRRLLLGAGLALMVVGYASFLVTEDIYYTSTGIDNRTNIVAAIGVATLAVGLVVWAEHALPARLLALGFSLAVALLAGTGTLITNTLADYWVAANHRQHAVVAQMTDALPTKLTNATVVLDGVCPEIGPGVVFASPYDLAGELQTLYRDPTIRAPVGTAAVEVKARGLVISTVLFGTKRPHFYPYRPRLLIYDWHRQALIRLWNAASARRYFATTPRPSCPQLRSFAWGIHTSRYVPFA